MKDLLVECVKKYAAEHHMFVPGCHITVALSGGLDSMCLLHILSFLSEEGAFTVSAAHFNHCIRGEEAQRDEEFVRGWCDKKQIPLVVGRENVPAYAKAHKMGLEEAARLLRYDFLQKTSHGGIIATAHNANDNAETVLLHLARGAGLKGLCGIPPVRENIIRPLLEVTRQELEEYASKHGIPHVEDGSNESDVYARNLIRHQVLPALCSVNSDFYQSIARNTRILREQNDWIGRQADSFLRSQPQNGILSASAFSLLPNSVQAEVVQKICGECLSKQHIDAIKSICRHDASPSAACSLPGRIVRREYDKLIFQTEVSAAYFQPFCLEMGKTVECAPLGLRFQCLESDQIEGKTDFRKEFLFNSSEIYGRIFVRSRKQGDLVHFYGREHTTNLKKLFIDSHIPAAKRDLIPVLADEKGIIAVYGFGIAARVAPKPGNQITKINIEEIIPS